MAEELTRMQFAETNALDRIEVIDFSTETPRLPLVDLRPFRPAEATTPSRSTLINNVVDDAITALRTMNAVGGTADETATQSYGLLRVLLDLRLENGADSVAITDLLADIIRYQRGESIGSATRAHLDDLIQSLDGTDTRSKQKIGAGAIRRLRPLFTNPALSVPIGTPPETAEAAFDLPAKLTDDTLYVFDFGSLGDKATALVSHLLVARIWRLADTGTVTAAATDETGILADVIIDEAHKLAAESLLGDILSQGRSSGVALTLLSQSLSNFTPEFRDQLDEEIGTVIAGEAGSATAALLEGRLPTETDTIALVEKLRGTEWLLRPKSKRDAAPKEPFVAGQHELRAGHPAHDGLYLHETTTTSTDEHAHHIERGLDSTLATATLPPTVTIEGCRPTCTECATVYPESHTGVANAYGCCRPTTAAEDDVDLPIVDVLLDSDVTHIQNTEYTIQQWQFLRLIERLYENAIDPAAFDVCTDSMTAIRNEVGLEKADIDPLVEADLVYRHPKPRKKYYSLTYKGATALNAIRGDTEVEFPDNGAEIKESIIHIRGRRIARRYLNQQQADPESPVTTIATEYDGMDLVGLTDSGTVHIAIEVERNNNLQTGAIEDYDTMADADPAHALWVVPNGDVAHDLVAVLAEPNTGPPRVTVDQLYSKQTSPTKYDLDADGCTDIKTYNQLLNRLS
jgi:hypothetical protein